MLILFLPLVPSKKKTYDPIVVRGHIKIYTDLNGMCWRVKKDGVRKDKKASFKGDAMQAWGKVNMILRDELK